MSLKKAFYQCFPRGGAPEGGVSGGALGGNDAPFRVRPALQPQKTRSPSTPLPDTLQAGQGAWDPAGERQASAPQACPIPAGRAARVASSLSPLRRGRLGRQASPAAPQLPDWTADASRPSRAQHPALPEEATGGAEAEDDEGEGFRPRWRAGKSRQPPSGRFAAPDAGLAGARAVPCLQGSVPMAFP